MQDQQSIQHLPMAERTRVLCWYAVRENVQNIQHVPRRMQTFEMAEFVVSRRPCLLPYIDASLQTVYLCAQAMKKSSIVRSCIRKDILGTVVRVVQMIERTAVLNDMTDAKHTTSNKMFERVSLKRKRTNATREAVFTNRSFAARGAKSVTGQRMTLKRKACLE